MLLNYISIRIFLISFALGLFFVYILGPETKTIYVYPTPENVDKILFKDKSDSCFKFVEEVVECPKNKKLITTIPIQA
jgi:hypothetical protein